MDANLGLLVTQPIVLPWLEHPKSTPETAWGWGVSVWRVGYTIITAGWNNKLAPN